MGYLTAAATQLGISIWLLVVILLWSIVWKLLALWKSARKGHSVWFIVLAVINTVGILEILYIYVLSELDYKKKQDNKAKKKRR
jgi:hypothetical protein